MLIKTGLIFEIQITNTEEITKLIIRYMLKVENLSVYELWTKILLLWKLYYLLH